MYKYNGKELLEQLGLNLYDSDHAFMPETEAAISNGENMDTLTGLIFKMNKK